MSDIIKVMKQPQKKVVLRRLGDQDMEDDTLQMTPEERILTMWQLALDSWSFTGRQDAQSRFQRHIVSVMRRAS